MRLLTLLAALAAQGPAFAQSDTAASGAPASVTSTAFTARELKWVQIPTAQQFAWVYPDKAITRRESGVVVLNCGLTEVARLMDCKVVSEKPTNEQFGAAALKLSQYFRAAAKSI